MLENEYEEDVGPGLGENATNEVLFKGIESEREDATTADGKSRLVIPSSFFKKPKYHPLQIFVSYSSEVLDSERIVIVSTTNLLHFQNPLPGLHAIQSQVSYSKVDEDYHLCPLPRYKLTNKSGTNRPDKAFIERPVSSSRYMWIFIIVHKHSTTLRCINMSPSL